MFQRHVYYIERDAKLIGTAMPRSLMNINSDPRFEAEELSSFAPERISQEEARRLWREKAGLVTRRRTIDSVLMWKRLNGYNYYHTLFEDLMPAFRTVCRLLGEYHRGCAGHDATALPMLVINDWAVDHWDPYKLLATFWPHWDTVNDLETKWVLIKELYVGSGSICLHPNHCSRRWRPGEVASFRKFAMHTLQVTAQTPLDTSEPRIVIINRPPGLRSINNLVETFQKVSPRLRGLASIEMVDVATISLAEQAALYNGADIVIALHGATMGNMLYARPHALFLDLQPTNFTREYPPGHVLNPYLGHIIAQEMTNNGVPISVEAYEIPIAFYHRPPVGTGQFHNQHYSQCETPELLQRFITSHNCEGCYDCMYHWVFMSTSFNITEAFLSDVISRAVTVWNERLPAD